MTQALESLLGLLHLPAIKAGYERIGQLAIAEHSSYEEYLEQLLIEEVEQRHANKITRNLKSSRLPLEKTLDIFDRSRLDPRTDKLLSVLVKGEFTRSSENILAFGSPGSGKTHLLCAVGHELIQQGKKVLFYPSSLLIQELLVAKRDLQLGRYFKRLDKMDAIIIDDIGYVSQEKQEMDVLFTFLADRYEKTSLLISSNLPFSKWEQIFKDPMTTAAAIDRLVHHSVIIEMNMKSYRLETANKAKRNG